MATEIYKEERRKKKIILIIVIIVILILGTLVFIFRHDIYREYKKMSTLDGEIMVNTGQLYEDNFPISITDDISYQFDRMGDKFIMLSDTHMYIYSNDGTIKDTRQHDYSNSILKTSGKRALVYESGGKNFKVEGLRDTIYTKNMENNIIFARINSNGYVAVVTTADMYACELRVFNERGEEIYYRGCVDRIQDLCFTNSNDGCIAVTLDALEGQIVSKLMFLGFKGSENDWISEPLETLCIGIEMTKNNNIFLFGDTKCVYYDMTGTQIGGYSYKNQLLSDSFQDGKCAIIFENEERRKTTMLLINDINSSPLEIIVDNDIKKIFVEDGLIYTLKNDVLETYAFDGSLVATAEVSDIYKDFIKIDDEIYLISYDGIDKIDYQT
ncbi:MAG: DUF5711 family protein [Oscillospiraceae bacterium]